MAVHAPQHDVDLTAALQRFFGFASFRHPQEEIVRRAVAGRDTLALMPTGAGKSLCYQLAAMLRPTTTLVISPLIALMKDQLDKLPPAIRAHATVINSSLEVEEVVHRQQGLAAGEYKLLYAAPERLRQRQFVAALRAAGIGLVVIDEVHCVSMWGHDFRPDYLFIRVVLEELGQPAVLGLTATATPAIEGDIVASLGRELETVRASVVRPNLRYEIVPVENEEERQHVMLAQVKALTGAGIVYARTRERCEQLAHILQRHGVRALHYHAGMDAAERTRAQERFLDGSARVIVATTAFGMGIDKADIRWIMLYNYPDSLEDYVQRVGRAGRDGQPSTCILLTSEADALALRRFARLDMPTIRQLRAVYRQLQLRTHGGWVTIRPEELAFVAKVPASNDPRVLVGMLESVGLLRRDFDLGRAMHIELTLPPPPDATQRIENLLQRYMAQARERAERMIAFAQVDRCRHQQVAEHFGETVAVPCGQCDVCSSQQQSSRRVPQSEKRAKRLPNGQTRSLGAQQGARNDQTAPLGEHEAPPLQETKAGEVAKRPPDDTVLYEQLLAWRLQKARASGVSTFMVLPDRTLRELTTMRPPSKRELAWVFGMDPAKIDAYGDELLALVHPAQ
jgi:RecQ family ATP-dependent DNA helicase